MPENRKIRSWIHFAIATALIIGVVSVYVFVYMLPGFKEVHLEQKKTFIEQMVVSTWTQLDFLYKHEIKNGASREDVVQNFAKTLVNERYGKDLNSYFWLIDTTGRIIAHPYLKTEEDKLKSQQLTFEMIYIARSSLGGFLEYNWQYNPDDDQLSKKLAYVKYHPELGLVIGTGIYYKDIEAEILPKKSRITIVSLIILAVLFLILLYVFLLGRSISLSARTFKEEHAKGKILFESVFEASPIPAVIYSPEGIRTRVNAAWESFFNTSRNTALFVNIFDFHRSDNCDICSQIREVFKGKILELPFLEFDLSLFGFSSEKRWMGLSMYPIYDSKNELQHVVAYFMDLRKMKENTTELLKLTECIRQSPVSIVITDIAGRIEYVNPWFEKLTQYSSGEVLGENPRILKSGLMPASTYEDLWATIKDGKMWHRDLLNKKKNGELIWERTSISPVRNELGEIINYVAIKEDITEQKRLQDELLEAKKKAEQSDKLKSSFLANVTHEIRTPMNAIVGFSNFLVEEDLDPDTRKEFSEHIKINGDTLLNLIDDIMDISLIEAGEIKIRKLKTNIYPLLQEIMNGLNEKNERIDKKHISFHLQADDLEKTEVFTDPNRLRQILANLLGNAFKYTQEGEVRLLCKLESDHVLNFEIKDTGVGIPKEQQELIFKPFTHFDHEFVSLHGGTGLGLSITKDLIQLLGGEISVESEVGKGSCFRFSIYIGEDEEEKTKTEAKPSLSNYYWPNKKILIVEDEETNFQFLQVAFRRKGVQLKRAKNGKEAVDLFKRGEEVDLVLMDLKMPVMGGKEATKQIREINSKIPIIAQTAYVFENELGDLWEQGFSNYIAKPIKRLKMFKMIDDYFKQA
jgi:PAS domain S-box-containing protein